MCLLSVCCSAPRGICLCVHLLARRLCVRSQSLCRTSVVGLYARKIMAAFQIENISSPRKSFQIGMCEKGAAHMRTFAAIGLWRFGKAAPPCGARRRRCHCNLALAAPPGGALRRRCRWSCRSAWRVAVAAVGRDTKEPGWCRRTIMLIRFSDISRSHII